MRKIFLFSLIIINTVTAGARDNRDLFLTMQDSLKTLQNQLYKAKTDEDKLSINKQFIATFKRALNTENSFNFSFDSLDQIGKLVSPDKKFRIYNWDLQMKDGTQQYFGFIQHYNLKTKKYELFDLTDRSTETKNPENSVSDNNKWFGMLYYKIIQKKYKKKTYYTLLALDYNDKLTSKKIIDVLSFDSKGVPKFGESVFEVGKKTQKRIIMEYSSRATVSLKYNEDDDLIIFDHLSPSQPSLEGQYTYYGPDGSFDAFEFKKGKWIYIKDIDARNGSNQSDKFYKNPSGGTAPVVPTKK